MATIQGIYIALFGRPADPVGLAFFNEATNNGADLTAIGDLAGTAEYQSRFEGMSNAEIVTAIYQSLFGRNPEFEGLQFFVNALESGEQNINTIAINILDGAQNEDADVVANKEAAANAWTAAVEADPDALAAYRGDAGIAAGQAYLANITDDESTIPSAAQLNAQLAALIAGEPPAPVPGDTFTLTDAVGENRVGTDNDDTFNAVLDTATPANGTLNVADQIDGAGGTDTLNLTVVGGGANGIPAGVGIKNVEIVNINYADDGSAFGALNSATFAGVQQLWQIDNDSTTPDFQNVTAGAGVTVGFRSTDDTVGTATITAAKGVDTLSVALDGTGTGTLTFAESKADDVSTLDISGSTAKDAVVTLSSSGAAPQVSDVDAVNLSISSQTQVAFAGAAFTGAGSTIETVDASGSTGNLTMNITNLNNVETVVLGSGKDTVTANLGAEDTTIDLGAGADTLNLNGTGAGASNSLEITLGAGSDTLNIGTALSNIRETGDDFLDGLISVTGFNSAAGGDYISIAGAVGTYVALTNPQITALETALSGGLSDGLDYLATQLGVADYTHFFFEGDAYIYLSSSAAAGASELAVGDGLIQLAGVTDLPAASASFIV